MVNVVYALRGANGENITFDNENFVLNPGMTGFGITPTTVRIEPSAGVGGVFRHSQRGVRDIDLPITIIGTDRQDVQTKLRKLARITQDQRGPMRLRATYPDGQQLFIKLHYTGGAESAWGGDNAGQVFCRWVLSAQAPQPFWESAITESFLVTGGGTGRGLLPEMTKLLVSSSDALGEVVVVSTADVEVFPVWTITGPITDFTATRGDESFSIPGTVGSEELIIIDTEKKTVVTKPQVSINGTEVNAYDRLGVAPKLFALLPGENTITLSGSGTDLNTQVRAVYALRFEVVHG